MIALVLYLTFLFIWLYLSWNNFFKNSFFLKCVANISMTLINMWTKCKQMVTEDVYIYTVLYILFLPI